MKKIPFRTPLTRRKFLGQAAAGVAAFTILPRHVLGGPGYVPPSEKINIALVGCGGQGRVNMKGLFTEADVQIIAVADPVDRISLEAHYFGGIGGRLPTKADIEKNYAEKTPNFRCADYEDFRVMLEKEKSIDAVVCATPDHLHAYVSIVAMRQGKHIFCEKPLTHNVWEARTVARIAKETGLATRMGIQGHSSETIRRTVEWIRSGAIGQVREVQAWTNIARRPLVKPGRPESAPVPAGVNWDLWLGPRPERPFSPNYIPCTWRDYWDFGTGIIGDIALHHLDPAFWALELGDPRTVEASRAPSLLDSEITPVAGIYRYSFDARGEQPPVEVTWYEGGLMPKLPPEMEDERPLGAGGHGVLFIGDTGKITCGGWGRAPRLVPFKRFETFQQPPATLPRSKGHHRDWLDACKGAPQTGATFEYGAHLTEVMLLGLVAQRTKKRLQWDAANMKVTNAPEADQYLREEYRAGWELPA